MLATSYEKWLIQDFYFVHICDGLVAFPTEVPIPVSVLATSQLSEDHRPKQMAIMHSVSLHTSTCHHSSLQVVEPTQRPLIPSK